MDRVEYEKMRGLEDRYLWYQGLHTLTRNAVRDHAAGFTTLLDAGCGTGGLLRRMREAYPRARLAGFDLSEHAVGLSRGNGAFPVIRSSLIHVGLRSESFDVVTCQDVLYFEGIDDRAALTELNRLLRKGGVLVLNLPAFEFLRSSHDRFVKTRRRFTRKEVVELLRATGFEIIRATYWNATLFPLVALLRILRRRGGVEESDLRPIPDPWNRVLSGIVRAEAAWIRRGSLPVGSSVFCVARKISTAA